MKGEDMGDYQDMIGDDSQHSGLVRSKSISRREFMKMAGIAGAAIGVGAGLSGVLGACGGEATTTSSGNTNSPASTSTGAASSTSTSTSVSAGAETGREIKIGFVSPLTGALATFGIPDKYCIERWTEYVGDGLACGDGKMHPIKFEAQDTQSDSNRAATVAGDLINNTGIDMMMVASTPDTVKPVVDQCEASETPCLSTDCPWQTFLGENYEKGYKWCYHAFFGNEDFMSTAVSIYNKLETNKVIGYLLPNDAPGNQYRKYYPGYLEQAGYKPIDAGAFEPGHEDFTTIIALFKGKGVEVLTGVMHPADFTNFWKQARQQSFFPKACLISKALLFPQAIDAVGEMGNGLLHESWWSPLFSFKSSLTGESCQEFAAEFSKRTGKQATAALEHYILGEEAVWVLKNATNPEDKASIMEAVAKMKLDSITGPIDFTAPLVTPTGTRPVDFPPGPGHKRPNVYDIGLAGFQWFLAKGGQWKFEETLVDNTAASFVTIPVTKPIPLERASS